MKKPSDLLSRMGQWLSEKTSIRRSWNVSSRSGSRQSSLSSSSSHIKSEPYMDAIYNWTHDVVNSKFPEACVLWDSMWKQLGGHTPTVLLRITHNPDRLHAEPEDKTVWGNIKWVFMHNVGWVEWV